MTATPEQSAAAPDGRAEVTLHDERLRVGTERHATERIRLERVVVTEQRTITVDVSHEEIRLTRGPVSGDTRLPGGPVADREPVVVVLHEERVVVTKTVVPVERVTLTIHAVTRDEPVVDTVRREAVTVQTGPSGS
jgi:uncharacterized protein (TIGR02271 family)